MRDYVRAVRAVWTARQQRTSRTRRSRMAVVDWGLIMAAGVMVTIPALIFFVVIQRYLIAGWGAGGLKG